MKEEIFNSYVDSILKVFRITREQLFNKSKDQNLVDARYMLYYLCSIRPMRILYIQTYMAENGYKVGHSSIIRGIKSLKYRMEGDDDYKMIIDRIKSESL